MAVLSNPERASILARLMREASASGETVAVRKPQLAAAIAAIDDGMDGVLVTLNQALPAAARTNLTTAQKFDMFLAIVRTRAGRS